MSVFALGLNHQTAPIDLRGRFAFPLEQLSPALKGLVGQFGHRACDHRGHRRPQIHGRALHNSTVAEHAALPYGGRAVPGRVHTMPVRSRTSRATSEVGAAPGRGVPPASSRAARSDICWPMIRMTWSSRLIGSMGE